MGQLLIFTKGVRGMSALRKIRPVAVALMTISLGLSLSCVGSLPAFAALTYYSDRTAFTTANPGLAVEDFEEGRLVQGNYSVFDQPLNSGTDNAVFSPGEILPGVSFSYPIEPENDGGFFLYGPGVYTLSSKSLANGADAHEGTPMVLDFGGQGQQAVGLDFYVFLTSGLVQADTHISVYGAGDVLLDSTTVGSSALGPVFFGVTSNSDKITRLTITGDYTTSIPYYEWEGIDNVTFNPVLQPPAVWRYDFECHYDNGNGDWYEGYFFDNQTYDIDEDIPFTDENSNDGYYQIMGMTAGDADMKGQVFVDSYYDVEMDRTYTPTFFWGDNSLGSEYGFINITDYPEHFHPDTFAPPGILKFCFGNWDGTMYEADVKQDKKEKEKDTYSAQLAINFTYDLVSYQPYDEEKNKNPKFR